LRTVTGMILALAIGAATGLSLTALSISRGTGAGVLRVGPWVTTPRVGTAEADPYARAVTARLGTLPLALGDGLTLVADTDDGGAALDGRCSYRVAGPMPPARYWTLGVIGPDYQPTVRSPMRRVFTSYEVLRTADMPVDVQVAGNARPGNWLPSGGGERIRLVLRLYDTPIATTISAAVQLPTITREGCP
jgi:hypothetical protein